MGQPLAEGSSSDLEPGCSLHDKVRCRSGLTGVSGKSFQGPRLDYSRIDEIKYIGQRSTHPDAERSTLSKEATRNCTPRGAP